MTLKRTVLLGLCAALAVGCASAPKPNATYVNPDEAGNVTGVGIESQDIRAMTDRMVRDMLANPVIARLQNPPYVIIDDGYFVNEGSQPINKRLITERLMIELNRAAAGRMLFVERQAEDMVREERERKRAGEVGAGANAPVRQVAGADYRLTGRIMTLDQVDPKSGRQGRYYQITFKLVDLESGLTVWSNLYEFKKEAEAGVLYR